MTVAIIGGTSASFKMQEAQLQGVMILPFAASPALISSWFNDMGAAELVMSPLPRFYFDGDIMPDRIFNTLVEGSVEGDELLVATLDNTTGSRINLRRVSMRFEEV